MFELYGSIRTHLMPSKSSRQPHRERPGSHVAASTRPQLLHWHLHPSSTLHDSPHDRHSIAANAPRPCPGSNTAGTSSPPNDTPRTSPLPTISSPLFALDTPTRFLLASVNDPSGYAGVAGSSTTNSYPLPWTESTVAVPSSTVAHVLSGRDGPLEVVDAAICRSFAPADVD